MKVVLDTNVFVSGIFFAGPPYHILKAWRDGRIQVVISLEILREYMRVGEILSKQFQDVNITPFLELLATNSEIILAPSLPESVSDDPDDDKFIACAIAGDAEIIISGDRDLIKIGEHKGVKIVTPRKFVDEYL